MTLIPYWSRVDRCGIALSKLDPRYEQIFHFPLAHNRTDDLDSLYYKHDLSVRLDDNVRTHEIIKISAPDRYQ